MYQTVKGSVPDLNGMFLFSVSRAHYLELTDLVARNPIVATITVTGNFRVHI